MADGCCIEETFHGCAEVRNREIYLDEYVD
jgi:hypothetical protein